MERSDLETLMLLRFPYYLKGKSYKETVELLLAVLPTLKQDLTLAEVINIIFHNSERNEFDIVHNGHETGYESTVLNDLYPYWVNLEEVRTRKDNIIDDSSFSEEGKSMKNLYGESVPIFGRPQSIGSLIGVFSHGEQYVYPVSYSDADSEDDFDEDNEPNLVAAYEFLYSTGHMQHYSESQSNM